ncbi:MAG: hypothetical protein K2X86_04675 [Cytophagaceae bacterium]|nr:hypothetical protein [Cytophagaceae bacterium]
MKSVLIILGFCGIFFSSCASKNYIYSNAALNKPYRYDERWDYRGYKPEQDIIQDDTRYRRYDPDRSDDIIKKIKAHEEI